MCRGEDSRTKNYKDRASHINCGQWHVDATEMAVELAVRTLYEPPVD